MFNNFLRNVTEGDPSLLGENFIKIVDVEDPLTFHFKSLDPALINQAMPLVVKNN